MHECFCVAVHRLGMDIAKPQAIEVTMQSNLTIDRALMPTRQNIRSHLQKFAPAKGDDFASASSSSTG